MVCYLLTVVIDFGVSDHNQSFGPTTPTLADAADLPFEAEFGQYGSAELAGCCHVSDNYIAQFSRLFPVASMRVYQPAIEKFHSIVPRSKVQ